ncbi:ribosome maturation factor [Treponema sp.]|uniref:ribosome maturation factor n=1 Tax=Treponema sp. TaxID=166 RepID=UPI003EFEA298
MEYSSFKDIPYFNECSAAVSAEGFQLVELHVVPKNGQFCVSAVIASSDSKKNIGVSDCAKAHRALFAEMLKLLGKSEDDISMEVCSPGIERNLKNAAEFEIFKGREVRVWDKNAGDWVCGKIKDADKSCVVLETEGGSEKTVAYADIAKAKFLHL